MAGAYAHVTLANLAREPARLERAGISARTIVALNDWLRFVELGALSPDYAYLADAGQMPWADRIHCVNNRTLLHRGADGVAALTGADHDKALAWLFGFASHMAGDMTIHPVVESIVGPYAQNQDAHRNCEMHQDAYIFARLDLGDVGITRHLESGVARCHAPNEPDRIDPVIHALWSDMLQAAYGAEFAQAAPDIDAWHRGFNGVMATIRKVNRLLPLARHVAVNLELDYPADGDIEHARFIHRLRTPQGRMDYDAVFDRAIDHVLTVWTGLDAAMSGDQHFLSSMTDWNLDTGCSVQTGELVFWNRG